jgi:hypothetical protein
VNGIALRLAKSLRRCASGENPDPMILMPSKPSLKSRVRRVRNVRGGGLGMFALTFG